MSQRIVFTTFYKNQIEAGDIGIFLEFVESLGILEPEQADADTVRKLQSKINFLIDGYNDDSRELLLPVFPIAEKLGWTFQQGLDFINGKGKPFGICMNCAEAEPSRKLKATNAKSRSPDQRTGDRRDEIRR